MSALGERQRVEGGRESWRDMSGEKSGREKWGRERFGERWIEIDRDRQMQEKWRGREK